MSPKVADAMFSLWVIAILAPSSAQSPLTSSPSTLTPSPSTWPSSALSASSSTSPSPPQEPQIIRPRPIILPPGPLSAQVTSLLSSLTLSPSYSRSSPALLSASFLSTPSAPQEPQIVHPRPIFFPPLPLPVALLPQHSSPTLTLSHAPPSSALLSTSSSSIPAPPQEPQTSPPKSIFLSPTLQSTLTPSPSHSASLSASLSPWSSTLSSTSPSPSLLPLSSVYRLLPTSSTPSPSLLPLSSAFRLLPTSSIPSPSLLPLSSASRLLSTSSTPSPSQPPPPLPPKIPIRNPPWVPPPPQLIQPLSPSPSSLRQSPLILLPSRGSVGQSVSVPPSSFQSSMVMPLPPITQQSMTTMSSISPSESSTWSTTTSPPQKKTGPCQLFKKKQSKLCSEMQKLEQKYGVGKFCNRYKASCNYNITDGPSDRKMLLWKNCYCDSLCEEMGDCCIDYDKWHTSAPKAPKNETQQTQLSCISAPGSKKRSYYGYIMIDSCPTSWWNPPIKRACKKSNYTADPLVALPVFDVTTNVSYANIYCAMCNGKSRNLHFWSVKIVHAPCRSSTLQDIKYTDTVWHTIPIDAKKTEKCIATPLVANRKPRRKIDRLCRSYANVIEWLDGNQPMRLLKNPHCALLEDATALVNKTVNCPTNVNVPNVGIRDYSTIFVFSIYAEHFNDSFVKTVPVKFSCPVHTFYNPFEEKCLLVPSKHSSVENKDTKNVSHTNDESRSTTPTTHVHDPRIDKGKDTKNVSHTKDESRSTTPTTHVHDPRIDKGKDTKNVSHTNDESRSTTPTTHVHDPRIESGKSSDYSLTLRITTCVGFSLSITALLFLLMTYFLFAELRTFPGKMAMQLSCAMIALQSVYFASDTDVVSWAVCAVMGALLHYFNLVVFLWTGCIAHDTHKTFTNPNIDFQEPSVIAKRKRSYNRCSLFSWGSPVVLVMFFMTLQLSNTANIYGNEHNCGLSFPARYYAEVTPVLSSLLFVTIALTRTVVAKNQQGNSTTFQNHATLPQTVLILTVATGITWILGLMVAFHPTPNLEYPYVIVKSCQGVLICILFVFKKQVITLYKQRFINKTNPGPEPNGDDQNRITDQEPTGNGDGY